MHVPETDPYPWPYDGALTPPTLALILAGWDTSWSARSLSASSVEAGCTELAEAVTAFGGAVVTIHHAGATALDLSVAHRCVGAFGIDAFHGGPLDDLLRAERRTHLLVAGFGLEAPVHSTLRSANDRGYECLLVTDACAPLTDDLTPGALSSVTMSGGIFGALGTSTAVRTTLSQLDPSTPVTA